MEVVSLEQMGEEAWDAFCDASPDAWIRHTSVNLDFAMTLGEKSENLSFALREGKEIRGIVPLMVQNINGLRKREFAMGGSATPYPALASDLSPKQRTHALQKIFEEIDMRAHSASVSYARFFVDPLTEPVLSGLMRINPLPAFGFHDTSITTVCINLSHDEKTILDGMADRRRRYIVSAGKAGVYSVEFFDRANITDEIFAQFEDLYTAAAGRRVGSPERWEHTLAMLKQGLAFLALVRTKDDRKIVAAHYASEYKQRSYDGLSAILPSCKNEHDVGSLMQWETIRYLKQRGFSHYEIGLLFPPTISEYVYSKKELAISHFKSLFGGSVLPVFRGEKYYDMEYLRERRQELSEQFVAENGNQTPTD